MTGRGSGEDADAAGQVRLAGSQSQTQSCFAKDTGGDVSQAFVPRPPRSERRVSCVPAASTGRRWSTSLAIDGSTGSGEGIASCPLAATVLVDEPGLRAQLQRCFFAVCSHGAMVEQEAFSKYQWDLMVRLTGLEEKGMLKNLVWQTCRIKATNVMKFGGFVAAMALLGRQRGQSGEQTVQTVASQLRAVWDTYLHKLVDAYNCVPVAPLARGCVNPSTNNWPVSSNGIVAAAVNEFLPYAQRFAAMFSHGGAEAVVTRTLWHRFCVETQLDELASQKERDAVFDAAAAQKEGVAVRGLATEDLVDALLLVALTIYAKPEHGRCRYVTPQAKVVALFAHLGSDVGTQFDPALPGYEGTCEDRARFLRPRPIGLYPDSGKVTCAPIVKIAGVRFFCAAKRKKSDPEKVVRRMSGLLKSGQGVAKAAQVFMNSVDPSAIVGFSARRENLLQAKKTEEPVAPKDHIYVSFRAQDGLPRVKRGRAHSANSVFVEVPILEDTANMRLYVAVNLMTEVFTDPALTDCIERQIKDERIAAVRDERAKRGLRATPEFCALPPASPSLTLAATEKKGGKRRGRKKGAAKKQAEGAGVGAGAGAGAGSEPGTPRPSDSEDGEKGEGVGEAAARGVPPLYVHAVWVETADVEVSRDGVSYSEGSGLKYHYEDRKEDVEIPTVITARLLAMFERYAASEGSAAPFLTRAGWRAFCREHRVALPSVRERGLPIPARGSGFSAVARPASTLNRHSKTTVEVGPNSVSYIATDGVPHRARAAASLPPARRARRGSTAFLEEDEDDVGSGSDGDAGCGGAEASRDPLVCTSTGFLVLVVWSLTGKVPFAQFPVALERLLSLPDAKRSVLGRLGTLREGQADYAPSLLRDAEADRCPRGHALTMLPVFTNSCGQPYKCSACGREVPKGVPVYACLESACADWCNCLACFGRASGFPSHQVAALASGTLGRSASLRHVMTRGGDERLSAGGKRILCAHGAAGCRVVTLSGVPRKQLTADALRALLARFRPERASVAPHAPSAAFVSVFVFFPGTEAGAKAGQRLVRWMRHGVAFLGGAVTASPTPAAPAVMFGVSLGRAEEGKAKGSSGGGGGGGGGSGTDNSGSASCAAQVVAQEGSGEGNAGVSAEENAEDAPDDHADEAIPFSKQLHGDLQHTVENWLSQPVTLQ